MKIKVVYKNCDEISESVRYFDLDKETKEFLDFLLEKYDDENGPMLHDYFKITTLNH